MILLIAVAAILNMLLSVMIEPARPAGEPSAWLFTRHRSVLLVSIRCLLRYAPLLGLLVLLGVLASITESTALWFFAGYVGASLLLSIFFHFRSDWEEHSAPEGLPSVRTRHYESLIVSLTVVVLPSGHRTYYLWLDDEHVLSPRFVFRPGEVVTVFDWGDDRCLFVREPLV